jgi:P2 family phage contractile tail tube protein
MNPVPEKLINFRVYLDGNDMLGVADVQLPDLEPLTDTVKGAGIAGEVESPVLGHFGSMGLTINWRTIEKNVAVLAQPKAHSLDLRGSQQVYDAGAGQYKSVPIRVVVRAVPKKTGIGKFDVGTTTDTSNEFEVTYIKVYVNGKREIEIDKFNYICYISGTDFLATVRSDLGL